MNKPKSMEELMPWAENPRTISKEGLQGLKKSMKRFGDLSGIVFNSRTGRLVTGHQRVKGLIADNPGIEVDADLDAIITDEGELFPIRTVDWDEDFELAANIAANHHALQGVFLDSVEEMIDQIELVSPDIWDELMLASIKAEAEVEKILEDDPEAPGSRSEPVGDEIPEMELLPFEHYDYLMIMADNVHDWEWIAEFFGLERRAFTLNSGKKLIGLARGIKASDAIRKIKEATDD